MQTHLLSDNKSVGTIGGGKLQTQTACGRIALRLPQTCVSREMTEITCKACLRTIEFEVLQYAARTRAGRTA